MGITRLRYFVDAARYGNFLRAAEANFMTQPAISQQIAALEKELEVTLFLRKRDGVKLTAAGERFYPYALQCIEQYEEMLRDVQRLHRESQNQLLLGLVNGAELRGLTEAINAFRKDHPELSLQLVQHDRPSIGQQLQNGEIDAAIALDCDLKHSGGLDVIPLQQLNVGLLVPIGHPLAGKDSISRDDLAGQDFVLNAPSPIETRLEAALRRSIQEDPACHVVAEANSQEFLITMVESGIAVAPTVVELCNCNRDRARVVPCPDLNALMDLTLSIACRKDQRNPMVRALIDRIVLAFQSGQN